MGSGHQASQSFYIEMVTRKQLAETILGQGQRLLDLGFVHVVEINMDLFRNETGQITPEIVDDIEQTIEKLVGGSRMSITTVDKLSDRDFLSVDEAQGYKWVALGNWCAFRSQDGAIKCAENFGDSGKYFDLSES